MREVASKLGVDAYMLDNPAQLDERWFSDDSVIGVTAGASAPEVLVQQVLDRLKKIGSADIEEIGTSTEDVVFRLPRDLQEISMQNKHDI